MKWNPSPSELAAQWISEQIAYEKGKENPPAIDRVIQMGLDDPHSLWPFILDVASQTDDQDTLEILGAGPLEDLIRDLGAEYFDRIEEQYRRSPTFREALSKVWIGVDDKHLVQPYSKLGCQIIGGEKV
jgi:hypothetical protein